MTGADKVATESDNRVSMAPPEIGIVLYPGVQLASVHGLTDLFGIASRLSSADGNGGTQALRVTHWHFGTEGGQGSCVYDTCPRFPSRPETVVIPLILVDRPTPKVANAVAGWLKDMHSGGATLASVCSGAFLLAETGLLAGRVVSTHWSCAEELAERFPDLRVDIERRIVDYGDVITAGGFMAWVDLSLRLISRLLGPVIAADTARFLTIDPDVQEQSYLHGFSPRLTHGDDVVLKIQHWLHRRDARGASLSAMAAQAHLEKRTFMRRFSKATGMTPAEYCRRLRVSRARELLEFSNRPIKEIASAVGYADTAAFSRIFQKMTELSPTAYRRQSTVSRSRTLQLQS